jgi:type I restriction enzyme M protein
MALGNLIKSWENIMRDDDGVNGTVQVLSQLVWMLFLKVYDLMEDTWELYEDDFESAIPEKCRWRNWAKGKSQKDQMTGDELVNFVNNTLFPTLKDLTVSSQSSKRRTIVKEMMAESYNYMKDGVCIRKAVNLLDGVNFDNQEEHHSFNMIYETLLRGLQSAGRSGEFYTPRALTSFITEKVNPQLGYITADFACGTGGFLIDAIEHLRKQVTKAEDNEIIEKTVFGVEKKQFPYMLCTTNMLLHNVNYPQVIHGNSLSKNVRDYKDSEKVDYVLMNPPYGGHEQNSIQINFPSQIRNSETSNLFMIEILYRLNENGKCGVILPDGFLQNEDTSLTNLKEKLFQECNVHTIIRLPGSCFAPYTSIATNLVFFEKTGETKETWFYRFDLPNGRNFSMKKNPISREKLSAIDEWWDNRVEIKDEQPEESTIESWKSRCVSIEEIRGGGYNLDYCGFPIEEKIIQSPEEVLASYISRREILEHKLDVSTNALKEYIEGNTTVKLQNIEKIANELGKLTQDFPDVMRNAILQSAIQGNLTERLSTDTCPDKLIAAAKESMSENIDGQRVKKKNILDMEDEDVPFEIPDSWRWVRLGSICIIARGGSPRPISNYITTAEDGVNWIKIGDTEKNGKYIYSTAEKIKPEGVSKSRFVHEGDFLLTNSMSYGRPYILKTEGCIHDGWLVISQPMPVFDQNYLYWLLSSYFAYNQFSGKASGEVVKNLNSDKVANSIFPLPPLEEQQRIVEQLNLLLPLCDSLVEK